MNPFRYTLAQTVAWCAGRDLVSTNAESLRTPELSPPSFAYAETFEQRREMVEELAEKRLKLLRLQGRYRVLPARDLSGGRLVLYDPDLNRFDSTSLVESYGYFNWDNLPPWDTWVAYVRDEEREREARRAGDEEAGFDSYLAAWAPPRYLELAAAGVRANAEGCLLWASDLGTPTAKRLETLEGGDRGLFGAYRRLTSRLSPQRPAPGRD